MIKSKSYNDIKKEKTNELDSEYCFGNIDITSKHTDETSAQSEPNDISKGTDIHNGNWRINKDACVYSYINILDDGSMSGNRAKGE